MFGLEKNLIEKVEKKRAVFYKVLKSCLKINKENILIISDYGEKDRQLSTMFAYGYYHAAISKNFQVNLQFQEIKKGFMHTDDHIIKALDNLDKESIVIIATSNKLGRIRDLKSFRSFCKSRGHRFISATGLGDAKTAHFDLFMEAMGTNHSRLVKKGLVIKKKLDKAKEIRIRTNAGTDLIVDVEGMVAIANIGNYFEKGTGGNIPAGEVYIPPKGYYGVKGKVVIDGSMKTIQGTLLLDEPVILTIEAGRIVKIEGKYAELLELTLKKYENRAKYPYRVRHIGELGIGINPGAVLLGSTIIDEKVLGTAHIAIGSNYWFGGDIKTVFHGDQIIKNPEIYVDGERLIL